MPTTLDDAFGHHVWATLRLIEVCEGLDPDALRAEAPGTFGSIIETLRHLVGADSSYLSVLSRGSDAPVDDSSMGLPELRETMERNGRRWADLLAGDFDPEAVLVRHRPDGSAGHAPVGIRMAQALHHGSDHRSQICTVLTTLGIEPPAIDVWDYAWADGRLTEVPPPD